MLNNGQTVWTEQFTNEGGPKAEFLFENGLNVNSTPQDWLMAFLPLYDGTSRCPDRESNVCFSHKWAKFTNMKAVQMGAGVQGGYYPSFVPFTYNEIERFIGLYILQGLNPSPQVEAKFSSQRADPVQGSDLCHQVFGDNAIKRHKQFKAFFSLQDPMKPAPTRKERPTYKVDLFLKHLQQVSMKAWRLGQNISGDEQTIGFQGRHADKLRITYKAEGDGFQYDALADSGFTWTFYFRNQPAPEKWTKKGYSPLHSCILGMFDQLENKFHNCWFDNLYLSARFAKAAWTHSNKVRISGPTRKSGRGLPKCVIQEEVKNAEALCAVRGTVKAAVLEGDDEVPGLLAVSYYDQKPVHFLSTVCEKIKWVQCEKKVYCVETEQVETMMFLRLSINNDYNYGMGGVDIADQLRNYYRFDHWMRKRKWWWSVFFWAIGVLLVNCYVSYKKFMESKKMKPISHYEFRKAIALALIHPEQYWPDRMKTSTQDNNISVGDVTCIVASKRSCDGTTNSSTPSFKKMRSTRLTNKTLCPCTGSLRNRLSIYHGAHMPKRPQNNQMRCALHMWGNKTRVRSTILHCETCNIHLCVDCFTTFHTIEETQQLQQQFPQCVNPSATTVDKDSVDIVNL